MVNSREKRPTPKSRRQYVLNSPALRLASEAAGAKPEPWPGFIKPALATPISSPPSGDEWLHEIKFDGYRIQVHVRQGQAQFFTRRGYDWTDRFKSIAFALGGVKTYGAIIDGEVIVPTSEGLSDFGALESELSAKRSDRLVFYAFDLLHLDGTNVRGTALLSRKMALTELLRDVEDRVKLSEHIEGNGRIAFRNACRMDLEGIVSKLRDGHYQSGRTNKWLKATCRQRETFLVAGISYRNGKFDGIYLARKAGRQLVYAGKVERGFTDQTAKEIRERLEPLIIKRQPIEANRKFPKATWVKPVLPVDVEYRALTGDRLMRHPSYKGIREDLV